MVPRTLASVSEGVDELMGRLQAAEQHQAANTGSATPPAAAADGEASKAAAAKAAAEEEEAAAAAAAEEESKQAAVAAAAEEQAAAAADEAKQAVAAKAVAEEQAVAAAAEDEAKQAAAAAAAAEEQAAAAAAEEQAAAVAGEEEQAAAAAATKAAADLKQREQQLSEAVRDATAGRRALVDLYSTRAAAAEAEARCVLVEAWPLLRRKAAEVRTQCEAVVARSMTSELTAEVAALSASVRPPGPSTSSAKLTDGTTLWGAGDRPTSKLLLTFPDGNTVTAPATGNCDLEVALADGSRYQKMTSGEGVEVVTVAVAAGGMLVWRRKGDKMGKRGVTVEGQLLPSGAAVQATGNGAAGTVAVGALGNSKQ
jgi:hypothetical protein